MKNNISLPKYVLLMGVSAIAAALAACQSMAPTPMQQPQVNQTAYATPEQAVAALLSASRHDDRKELLKILGPQSEKLVYSGDAVADRKSQKKFTHAYDAYHRLEGAGPDKEVLIVGTEEWPMPIPLVHQQQGWMWDTAEGERTILDRRIGRNELAVIEVCREYVEAQREYADMQKRSGNIGEYAQRINSSPGAHDGLYWPAAQGQEQSPFGPLMADAQAEGYSQISGRHAPYHGYYFRILKQQGPSAAGGEKDYMDGDRMTRGFALIAFPAVYGDSGVKSFIVNHNGIVYEKDLGPDTSSEATQIHAYDPDESWHAVQ